jgi:plasmid maintenance system killer protein
LTTFKTSKHLTIVAAAKKSSDLVVVAEERHEKLCASVLKDESEIAVAAAFEKLDS